MTKINKQNIEKFTKIYINCKLQEINKYSLQSMFLVIIIYIILFLYTLIIFSKW